MTFEIHPPRGSRTEKRRVGRGEGSGRGKTCGRGMKGQKARSANAIRPGFEGGQMPLFRRLASRGFSNHPFKETYIAVNLGQIEERFQAEERVDLNSLVQKGLIKKSERKVKILGGGELTKKLTVAIEKISASAKSKIERVGGVVVSYAEDQK